jgi:hypothetical protein
MSKRDNRWRSRVYFEHYSTITTTKCQRKTLDGVVELKAKKKLNVFILNTTQPYIEVLKID